METIQSENEMELNQENQIDLFDQLGEDFLKKKFRHRLLATEILSYGVGRQSSIFHAGSSYMDGFLFTYISDLYNANKLEDLDIKYTALDVKNNSVEYLSSLNRELFEKINNNSTSKSIQEFIDENSMEFDWSILTGIFDKNKYGSEQFKFIDTILFETMKFSKYGIIFSFDSIRENSNAYNIVSLCSYLDSTYGRYKITKIDDSTYTICLYKYQYSL